MTLLLIPMLFQWHVWVRGIAILKDPLHLFLLGTLSVRFGSFDIYIYIERERERERERVLRCLLYHISVVPSFCLVLSAKA